MSGLSTSGVGSPSDIQKSETLICVIQMFDQRYSIARSRASMDAIGFKPGEAGAPVDRKTGSHPTRIEEKSNVRLVPGTT